MGPAYAAFVVRWWRLSDGSDRVVVERVATGERAGLGSLAAALAWIGARHPTDDESTPHGVAETEAGKQGGGRDD